MHMERGERCALDHHHIGANGQRQWCCQIQCGVARGLPFADGQHYDCGSINRHHAVSSGDDTDGSDPRACTESLTESDANAISVRVLD